MREDEDQIRQYMPVLRRIIILVAVLTAIPVVMWTITAFVRTYVGPPKTPTFQRMAATTPTSSALDKAAAAPTDSLATGSTPAAPQPIVEAKTATTDVDGTAPAPEPGKTAPPGAGATPPDAASPNATPPNTAPTAAAPGTTKTADITASNPPADASPSPSPDNGTPMAAQPPAATDWPASPPAPAVDASPNGTPIAGPVPLPRKRPKTFVLAQASVPLPMPRPDAAGPAAPEATPTPLDWLKHVFRPQSGASAASPSEDSGGYAEMPH